MLKTEAEARRAQCRHVDPVVQVAQGSMRITFHACSASDCMAWRWTCHTKVENREARPLGFCGREQTAPVEHDFGLGDRPLNAAESLLEQPTGSA